MAFEVYVENYSVERYEEFSTPKRHFTQTFLYDRFAS